MHFKDRDTGIQEPKPIWVNELMAENNNWDTSQLHKWFELDDVKTIQTVHIPLLEVEDEFTWEEALHGNYSTISNYWLYTHLQNPDDGNSKF